MHAASKKKCTILTAGSNYLDIDAYACMVGMAELLRLQGEDAIAYSLAPCNYSVCKSLLKDGQLSRSLPSGMRAEDAKYIIVDVSDPDFLGTSVPLKQVIAVYDHHVGFEEYWQDQIGAGAHIEFIGAAATLIYRQWVKAGLEKSMSGQTALLLIAAILDNTLNLTSSNTTAEDIAVFKALCQKEGIDDRWCASYFAQVQESVEADLKNALFDDVKTVHHIKALPSKVAQLCVWDAHTILERLPQIRQWFEERTDSWMLNIIDIKHQCSHFVCDEIHHQKELEKTFDVHFESGVAQTPIPYLRKEIIKTIISK